MITKGGTGSGTVGHRTAKDSVIELDPKTKKNALAKLKAEQAKRTGKDEPKSEPKAKADQSKQLSEDLIAKIIQRVKEKLVEQS